MTNNYFCLTKPGFLTQNLKDSIYLSIHFYLQSQGKASWGRLWFIYLRELKQLYDDDHNDDLKKNNRFNDQNNSSALTVFSTDTFPWLPLHDYDVKPPAFTFYVGREHTTTNFPLSFWTWIKSLRIQLQEKWPAFDILRGSKLTILISLKERKHFFTDVFTAVVVVLAQGPYYPPVWRHRVGPLKEKKRQHSV